MENMGKGYKLVQRYEIDWVIHLYSFTLLIIHSFFLSPYSSHWWQKE